MSFLGIDIGSSRVKAAVYAASGTLLASAGRAYSYAIPAPGRMELDSRAVLDAAFAAIAECASAVAGSDPVAAIGVSSQGEAFTPVGADGEILGPAMISGDVRAGAEIAEFSERFGADRLYRITGHTPSPLFTLGKLLWLFRHAPDTAGRARYFLCFEDLLIRALTGRAAMGWPMAGRTMMFDVVRHRWSPEILDGAGIDGTRLADPLPSGSIAGTVLPDRARALSLASGAVAVTGGHDQVIGALGCGAFEPGTAMFAAGSVECMVPVLDRAVFSDDLRRANLCTYDFALPGCYATLAYSLTGSNMQEYYRREFGGGAEYAALLDSMPSDPTSLLVLPYLTCSGTPWFDAVTPGCVYGWRFDTTRGTLLKGWWEGIACELRQSVEFLHRAGVKVGNLVASGGGFRHPAVVRLHADVLNVPIAVTGEAEAGCRGAALLARRALEPGCGLSAPRIVSVTAPDPERAARYAEKFAEWECFSGAVRGFAHRGGEERK